VSAAEPGRRSALSSSLSIAVEHQHSVFFGWSKIICTVRLRFTG
jgi:hypothetical protein